MTTLRRRRSLGQRHLQEFAEPLIRETISRLLTKRHVDRDDVSLSKALHPASVAVRARLASTNVVGVGFGTRKLQAELPAILQFGSTSLAK